ncbi:MAG: hypothetical protein WD872_01785 [Pirellulaceae bacterium]
MELATEESRVKALDTIRRFCQKPHTQHGKRRTKGDRKGWYEFHDWGHLVLRLHHQFHGTMLDSPTAAAIAQPLRKEFPNTKDWNKEVNRKGAHEHILDVIEQGIASNTLAPEVPAAAVAETASV